jgi:FlaA1/EpsC-like NDP-sugar epimerase
VPSLRDILDGQVTVSQIRNLSIEDLLERAPVGLDLEPVQRCLQAGADDGIPLSEVAVQHAVETSVLISADKAVNSTSVEGAGNIS